MSGKYEYMDEHQLMALLLDHILTEKYKCGREPLIKEIDQFEMKHKLAGNPENPYYMYNRTIQSDMMMMEGRLSALEEGHRIFLNDIGALLQEMVMMHESAHYSRQDHINALQSLLTRFNNY